MCHVLEESVMRLRNWVAIWIGQILVQRFDRVILQKGHLTLAQHPEFVSASWSPNLVMMLSMVSLTALPNNFGKSTGKSAFAVKRVQKDAVRENGFFDPPGVRKVGFLSALEKTRFF